MTQLRRCLLSITMIALAALLSGCVTTPESQLFARAYLGWQPEPPPAAAPKPEPKTLYFKQGASSEEFQRTKAACAMKMAAVAGTAGAGAVFIYCMRSEGWVLTQQDAK
jgi:hypothetical protein